MKKALSAIVLSVLFLSFGISAGGQDSLNSQLLHAGMACDTARIQSLLDRGADIEAKDVQGNTVLMMAQDHNDLTEILLKRGANLEARNMNGSTVLMMTAGNNYADTVKLLLDRGADIEAQDAIGRTALTAAASSYDDKADGMRVLLERGANIEAKDKYGRTALFGAVHSAELSGHPNRVLMLLDHKANIMVRDTSGNTALTLAACETWVHPTFKLRVVKLLVDRGAEIEARNNIGETAMSCAQHTKEQALADYLEMTVMRRKLLDRSAKWHVKEGFVQYMSAFAQNPSDEALRQRIIALSGQLPEPPPIPEEARQLFTAASDQIKQAGTPAALDQPIALLRKALEIAPWWSNAYYNLSRALEMRGQYDDAARQLNYYLELKPAEADASEARAHLVVIQAEEDAAAAKQ